jgi:hypothetical protein
VLHGFDVAYQLGAPAWAPAEEQAARNNLAWLRQRQDMFVQENPAFKNKQAAQGTKTSVSAGRNEFDPFRDRIVGSLLTGDAPGARQAMKDWLSRFPAAQRVAASKSLRESVIQSNPLKPSGSVSAVAQAQFLSWARTNLPKVDVDRILKLSQTYSRAADAAGFSIRVPQHLQKGARSKRLDQSSY